ncbi:MAG: hypothetical protein NDJ90_04910 [Oligoflexia bacterium]|nr:hypothetical protein [Oligoflexia bacterium]
MLQNSPLRSTEEAGPATQGDSAFAADYSVPGKIFILGEYAVLAGLPAVVAAVGPRFQAKVTASAPDPFPAPARQPSWMHPRSPVAQLLDWASDLRAPRLEMEFEDPFGAAGGFGGSTAQFALAYRALAELEKWDASWQKAWKLYRELTRGTTKQGLPPSGADLVAQWEGGVVLFEGDEEPAPTARNLWKLFDWQDVLVFSATGQQGRKVATHEHLATLGDAARLRQLGEALRAPLMKGIQAIRENHHVGLGSAMNEYAEALSSAGLEIPPAREDREALSRLPGVLGVKGAGALQADALLVLLEPGSPHRQWVIEEALGRDLALLRDGLACEPGVSCHS